MSDTFNNVAEDASSPAREAFSITPHDTNDLTRLCRSLWVGGAGNVKVDTVAGDTVTFAVGDTSILPVQVKRVYATGTTATGIVGLY